MAITNAQQYKQLVNPPMKGNKRPGYRGTGEYGGMGGGTGSGLDEGSAGGSGNTGGNGSDNRDRYMGTMGKTRPGRNPMAQFGGGKPPPAYDEFDKPSTRNFNFMKDARKAVNPFGLLSFLAPNPFGFRDFTGTPPTGGSEPVPYWAQLGFSSEEEYLASLANRGSSTEEPEPEVEEPFQLARRFRAEGGIMNNNIIGGEFDFESARQMYGLGKLVKKATKTVKKIAKSDIGKAAILGAIAFGIPGLGASGGLGGGIFGRASFGGYAPGVFGFGGIGNALTLGKLKATNFLQGSPLYDEAAKQAVTRGPSLLSKIKPGTLITGASVLAGLLTPEEEQQAQELADNTGFDIEKARNSILAARREQYAMDSRARRFRAEGGSMKEPVAKKTMPLLDMGGQEMDLRAEGGFVPIGRMEKADDVPARLSKNEFVFTADAVRNAGDGDVDKGAEVMYNMMKNLEAGGEVSEESQGLEGARKMFQTSQRLEEVL